VLVLVIDGVHIAAMHSERNSRCGVSCFSAYVDIHMAAHNSHQPCDLQSAGQGRTVRLALRFTGKLDKSSQPLTSRVSRDCTLASAQGSIERLQQPLTSRWRSLAKRPMLSGRLCKCSQQLTSRRSRATRSPKAHGAAVKLTHPGKLKVRRLINLQVCDLHVAYAGLKV
jgi:hypothetical protein